MLWKIRTFSTNEKLRFLLTWIVLDILLFFLLHLSVLKPFYELTFFGTLLFLISFFVMSLFFKIIYLFFTFLDQKSISQWIIYTFGIIFLGTTIYHVFFTPLYPRDRDSILAHTKIRMNYIGLLLGQFKEKCTRYPLTEEGFEFVIEKDRTNACKTIHRKGFLLGGEDDEFPWGQKYIYTSDGTSYELKSEISSRVFFKTDKLQFHEI